MARTATSLMFFLLCFILVAKMSNGIPATCQLPPATGNCLALFTRFYFNTKTGRCETFIYGGCGRNGNNFLTAKACQKKCSGHQGVSNEIPATCQLPSATGPCRARFPRFYFNTKTGRCETFIYGGCGGNGNNFVTAKACQEKCFCH